MHVLIIHDNDQDGYCAAAIAKKHYAATTDTKVETTLDTDEIDWKNCEATDVVFLDHTPSISLVNGLLSEDKKVLILDHHPETWDTFSAEYINNLVAFNADMCTCKQAWLYFNKDAKVPFTIEMINKWDTWNHDEESVLPFHYGMECMNLSDDELWEALLFQPTADAEMQIIAMGNAVGQFWLSTMNEITEPMAWVVEKDGVKYSICNSQLTSSYDLMTHIKKNDCVGAVWFWLEPDGINWTVSIKVLPDEGRQAVSRKETLTYDQLKESWFPKEK